MSDTAERLRLYARQFEDQHAPQTITIAMREAADEIERLRAALEEIAADIARAALEGSRRAALDGLIETDGDLI